MIIHDPETNQYHWEEDAPAVTVDPPGPIGILLTVTPEELEILESDVSSRVYQFTYWWPAGEDEAIKEKRWALLDRLRLMKAHLEAPACHHP